MTVESDRVACHTAVEYIESTRGGGQFIDTGYAANGQTKVVMDAFVPARWEQNDRFGVMRLYSFRITEGETLKRDFVPCIRLADAVAGLYDMVEGVFYENAGTGTFTMSASNLPFGRELTSGTYEITESFAFAAPAMESALKIAEGATVTLNIAAGVEVTLRGGDAHEVWGGSAGYRRRRCRRLRRRWRWLGCVCLGTGVNG